MPNLWHLPDFKALCLTLKVEDERVHMVRAGHLVSPLILHTYVMYTIASMPNRLYLPDCKALCLTLEVEDERVHMVCAGHLVSPLILHAYVYNSFLA